MTEEDFQTATVLCDMALRNVMMGLLCADQLQECGAYDDENLDQLRALCEASSCCYDMAMVRDPKSSSDFFDEHDIEGMIIQLHSSIKNLQDWRDEHRHQMSLIFGSENQTSKSGPAR